MKTRAQLRQEAKKENPQSSAQKTKKQALEAKQAKKEQAKGKGQGRKKIKKQESPANQTKTNIKGKTPEKTDKQKSSSKEKKDQNRRSSLRKRPSLNIVDTKPTINDDEQKQIKAKKEPTKKENAKAAKKDNDKATEKQADKADDPATDKEEIKKFKFKGKIPIDEHCHYVKDPNYHILQHGGKVYSATLNQTSVQNNNNKFYILQILQNSANSQHCYFFTRWGRVGVVGQNSCLGPFPIQRAIAFYNEKYKDKHDKGNYRQVKLNYENQEDEGDKNKSKQTNPKEDSEKDKQKSFQESKLSKPIRRFIQLIFDLNMMNKQMVQIGYNVSKMPLGKLSKDNIKHGYSILEKLVDQLKGKARRVMVEEFTNDFYSFIPHDFGFNKMHNFILDTEAKVKKKIEMLESLAQIKVATSLLSSSSQDENKIDSNYKKLKRQMQYIDPKSQLFNTLNNYLQSTHGNTHTTYSLQIEDLFQLSNEAENLRYTKDIHNKMLLWHGSRLTNFVGILSQGLRIAPPEAPVSGYMFGKGVYFADMSSKSANYCFTSRENSTGILLLCEVALGNMNEKYHADFYASNLPADKHSTKGLGKTVTNPANEVKLKDGVVIPMGPGQTNTRAGCSLQYNEFIVYDIAQIKIRYLLRTKFNHKKGPIGY